MGYSEWSDDESNSRRDKFRPEREKGSNVDDYDTYNRKKRTRSSPIPPEGMQSVI
jgi:hypothetical protein